jgi:acylphosphatase
MKKRAIITIFGEVQGVFFRVNTQAQAQELGLTGWVKNEADATVKILAEGEQEQLEKLVDYCRSGHKLAKVQRVEVKWEEATGEFKDFDIIYN